MKRPDWNQTLQAAWDAMSEANKQELYFAIEQVYGIAIND